MSLRESPLTEVIDALCLLSLARSAAMSTRPGTLSIPTTCSDQQGLGISGGAQTFRICVTCAPAFAAATESKPQPLWMITTLGSSPEFNLNDMARSTYVCNQNCSTRVQEETRNGKLGRIFTTVRISPAIGELSSLVNSARPMCLSCTIAGML